MLMSSVYGEFSFELRAIRAIEIERERERERERGGGERDATLLTIRRVGGGRHARESPADVMPRRWKIRR